MNRTQWYQHWHNIRSSNTPSNYGVKEVHHIFMCPDLPRGEMAYGYKRGCMSIMQQPITKRKTCPICGVIRTGGLYYWISPEDESIVACNVCHPPAGVCADCNCRCSEHELAKYEGVCEDCQPR